MVTKLYLQCVRARGARGATASRSHSQQRRTGSAPGQANGSAPNGCHCRFRNCCVICYMLCKFTSCAQEVRGSRLLPARIHSKGETAVHQDRRRSLRLSASGEPQPAAPRLANWKTRPVTKMIYFQSIMIVMVLCKVVDPPPL